MWCEIIASQIELNSLVETILSLHALGEDAWVGSGCGR